MGEININRLNKMNEKTNNHKISAKAEEGHYIFFSSDFLFFLYKGLNARIYYFMRNEKQQKHFL